VIILTQEHKSTRVSLPRPKAPRSRTHIGVFFLASASLLACGCQCALPRRHAVIPAGAPRGGAFSPAIRVGETLYVAGQIPIDPATSQLVEGGIEAQTRQTLDNVKRVVEAAGFAMADIVSCTVYLVDIGDFAVMNSIYSTYFPKDPPARATVAVTALARGARIEISAIAAR
jgi:2-iminobutanoate/2-iminopropanoate deaminase